jgi:hypothetical protein
VRIGVVEAQIAASAQRLGQTEVEHDRLGVPDVQIAVRLGRKAGNNPVMRTGSEIRLDDLADEMGAWRLGGVGHDVSAGTGLNDDRRILPAACRPMYGFRRVFKRKIAACPPEK